MTRVAGQEAVWSRNALTVGLVVASEQGPAWLVDVIKAVEGTGDAAIIDVEMSGRVEAAQGGWLIRGLLRAYDWIDGHLFGRSNDPSRVVGLGPAIAEITASGARRAAPDRDADIVIRLDGGTGPVARWPAPAFGVWTLEHGMGLSPTARSARFGLAPGGPEMLLDRSFTISQLVATSRSERRVIGQVVSGVDRLSLRRGTRGHLLKLPGLVARTVSAVSSDGALPDAIVEPRTGPAAEAGGATLSASVMAVGLARIPVRYVGRLLKRKVAPERWVVAIRRERGDRPGGGSGQFRFLDAPDGREWADPFPLRTPDADLLFVEEYAWARHRGSLAVVELDDSRRGWRSVRTILDLPKHVSYPFVFHWAGSWFLLPEQAATGSLQLYVAETFPTVWRWHSTALDQPAVDATIVQIDGRWWMFAAISVVGGIAADELHLFHAETPLGPWTAHARNPVASDVRTARPAGRVYQRDGAWYRVAQNGAISYGHSIAIVRIDRIDLDGYRETVVDVIRPDWAPGLTATHTLNSDDGLTAMDARRIRATIRLKRPHA